MKTLLILTTVTIAADAVWVCVLYYVRSTSTWSIAQSDLLLFGLPAGATVVVGGYLFVVHGALREPAILRLVAAAGWGTVAALLGVGLGALVAFNLLGT